MDRNSESSVRASGATARQDDGLGARYAFGPFELCVAQRSVSRSGERLAIGARAFDILTALVSRPGKLVSKDELMQAAWPDTTVADNSLAVHVAALRRVLGDEATGARYIANLAGRGYVFVAPVKNLETGRPDAIDAAAAAATADADNLPLPLVHLIGREETIERLVRSCCERRLLCVVGPGGVGKTSAVLAVAAQLRPLFPDGVHFVDLAPVSDSQLVASAVAQVVGLTIGAGGAEITLAQHFKDRRALIVLDNCEHLIDVAAQVASGLLQRASAVHILATSREALSVPGEWVHRLEPLALPLEGEAESRDNILRFAAPQMFESVAAAATGSFAVTDTTAPIVAEICRRLDGLPLAIELAASRVSLFGVAGLLDRLDESLNVLSRRGRLATPRQQTLQATLEWSYRLLTPNEQRVLRRLSIFRGKFALNSALALSQTDDLAGADGAEHFVSLVAKSLVTVDGRSDPPVYRLTETTREFGMAKASDAGELEALSRSCAKHLLDLFSAPTGGAGTMAATAPYLVDDLRRSAQWALDRDGDIRLGCDLIIASAHFWLGAALPAEFFRWATRAVQLATQLTPADADLEMRLANILALADLENGLSDVAKTALNRALSLAENVGDAQQELISLCGLFQKSGGDLENEMAAAYAERIGPAAVRASHPSPDLLHGSHATFAHFFLGEPVVSLQVADHWLARVPPRTPGLHTPRPFELDPRISLLTSRCRSHWICGGPNRALEDAKTALDEAAKLDHPPSYYLILTSGASAVALWRRDMPFAEELLNITTGYADSLQVEHWKIWQRTLELALAPMRLEGERPPRSALATREMEILPYSRALLCTAHEAHHSGWLDQRMNREDPVWCREEFDRVRGVRLYASHGPSASVEAEQIIRGALTSSQAKGARGWALRAATSLAELLGDLGRGEEGQAILEREYGQFTEGFETHDLRLARSVLDACPIKD